MRKVIAFEWMSLDGVVQAPANPNEDVSGGFTHGGWHIPYFDAQSMKWVLDNVSQAGGYLLGRRTYERFGFLEVSVINVIFVHDSFPHLLCVMMRLCFSVLSTRASSGYNYKAKER